MQITEAGGKCGFHVKLPQARGVCFQEVAGSALQKDEAMRQPLDGALDKDPFAAFILRLSEAAARARGLPPATVAGWEERLMRVRAGLERSFGRMPAALCPLEPVVLGTLEHAGFTVERLTFQSRPGVRVTANLYRPNPVKGPCPAVLSVHGHWAWARIDPHVQPRCIGLAKLGYVVLSVDAFGSGERADRAGRLNLPRRLDRRLPCCR